MVNPLIVLIIVAVIFLALSRVIGKVVEALIGTVAILAILWAIARHFGWI